MEFRRSLAASFLFKGLLFAAQQLEADSPGFTSPFPDNYRSGKCCAASACPALLARSVLIPWPAVTLRPAMRQLLGRLCSLGLPSPWLYSLLTLPGCAAVKPYERPSSHGLQYFSAVPGEDVVGQPYRHMAADQQASLWALKSLCLPSSSCQLS